MIGLLINICTNFVYAADTENFDPVEMEKAWDHYNIEYKNRLDIFAGEMEKTWDHYNIEYKNRLDIFTQPSFQTTSSVFPQRPQIPEFVNLESIVKVEAAQATNATPVEAVKEKTGTLPVAVELSTTAPTPTPEVVSEKDFLAKLKKPAVLDFYNFPFNPDKHMNYLLGQVLEGLENMDNLQDEKKIIMEVLMNDKKKPLWMLYSREENVDSHIVNVMLGSAQEMIKVSLTNPDPQTSQFLVNVLTHISICIHIINSASIVEADPWDLLANEKLYESIKKRLSSS